MQTESITIDDDYKQVDVTIKHEKNQIRFRHFGIVKHGMTVAYSIARVVVPPPPKSPYYVVRFGLATRTPLDDADVKIGRKISFGRLAKLDNSFKLYPGRPIEDAFVEHLYREGHLYMRNLKVPQKVIAAIDKYFTKSNDD